ncbi:MAG: bifunctional hydroxymethylpyrimidine kinase/phosphomethylpyrimidine kinase [Hyphomicrobiaceae bacterium]
MVATPPVALTLAGSDSSGGAGIQADLKTFTALGVYGASVITALTAQNTCGVSGVLGVPQGFVTQQIDAVFSDLDIRAAKTGMLGDRQTVSTVADGIARHGLKSVVVDPVMVATSGDVLLSPDAVDAVRLRLAPRALVLTPNLQEAARLLDENVAHDTSTMERQARALLALGCRAVLVKGGHGAGDEAIDVLAMGGDGAAEVRRFAAPRITTVNTHGTGCTLSAAIAARLALGDALVAAIAAAKSYLTAALVSGAAMRIGHCNGPVDHLFAIRATKRPGG